MNIQELDFTFENIAEHRPEDLARLIVMELYALVSQDHRFSSMTDFTIDELTMQPVVGEFERMTDQETAQLIAEKLYNELLRQLPISTRFG